MMIEFMNNKNPSVNKNYTFRKLSHERDSTEALVFRADGVLLNDIRFIHVDTDGDYPYFECRVYSRIVDHFLDPNLPPYKEYYITQPVCNGVTTVDVLVRHLVNSAPVWVLDFEVEYAPVEKSQISFTFPENVI